LDLVQMGRVIGPRIALNQSQLRRPVIAFQPHQQDHAFCTEKL